MNPTLLYLEARTWDLVGAKAKRLDAARKALELNETVGEGRRLSKDRVGEMEGWERGENPKGALAPEPERR
jgi:hypothetical protein